MRLLKNFMKKSMFRALNLKIYGINSLNADTERFPVKR